MKKLLLSAICALSLGFTFGQCTPGANFADSTFGAWPDTTTNFPDATVNLAYSTDLNFKVPQDAGDIDPAFAGNTIIDFKVDSVVGLPAGMDYTCNISNCTYAGGANGCAQISGTCSVIGANDISIHITANLSIFGFPVPVPYEFSGYHINVNDVNALEEMKANLLSVYPNPAKEKITLKASHALKQIDIKHLDGKIVASAEKASDIDVSKLESGIYLLTVVFEGHEESVRIVVE